MVKKRESKQRTRGKSFIEWCTENGERGERLANEFKDPDKLPTEVCKASTYKALWKCLKCKHAWRAMVCNRTKSDTPTGCPKCGALEAAGLLATCPLCSKTFFKGLYHPASQKLWQHMGRGKMHRKKRQILSWDTKGWNGPWV